MIITHVISFTYTFWGQAPGNWGTDPEHVGTDPIGNWGTDPTMWGQALKAPRNVRAIGCRKGVYAWGGCGIMQSDEPPLVAGWSGRTGRNRRLT